MTLVLFILAGIAINFLAYEAIVHAYDDEARLLSFAELVGLLLLGTVIGMTAAMCGR